MRKYFNESVYSDVDNADELEDAEGYILDAIECLNNYTEFEDICDELLDVKGEIEIIFSKLNEKRQKVWEQENKELEREFYNSRL